MAFLVPIIAATPGLAGLSGVATWLGSNTILAGVARMGLGIAAKYAIGRLIQPSVPAQTVKLETTYGEDRPREVILGKVGTSGNRVYRNAHGGGNRRVGDIYVLSHFRVQSIPRVRAKGKWRNVGGSPDDDRGIEIPGTEGDAYINPYLGTMDQTADPFTIEHANSAGRWTSNHRGAGVAYAIINARLNRDNLTSPPEVFFEVLGPLLYDWRKDSSVGGSGTDRWSDQSTWSGRFDNPVLQMYALERGIFNGDQMMVGKGVSASRLPLAQWTIAANICDEVISGKRRYSSGLIAAAGQGITHDQNMQPLLEACAATWVEDASGEYPIVGAVQSPIFTFTDDDIVPDEPLRFSKYRTRSELVNTVSGTWKDPEKFYEAVPFKMKVDTSAKLADRETLASSVPFSAVNDVAVADRLADIALRASRYQANADVVLPPRFIDKAKAGYWCRWNSAKHGDRVFQVLEKRLSPIGPKNARNVGLKLQEVGNGIFDPTEYVTVPVVPTPPGEPVYASEASNFQAQNVGIQSDSGELVPAFRFSWNAFDDATVTAVMIEYRPVGTEYSIVIPASVPVQVKLSNPVLANTLYEYRHWIVTQPGRVTFPTSWQPITSGAAALPPLSVGLAQVQASITALLTSIHLGIDDLSARLEQVAVATAEGMGVVASENAVAVKYRDATAKAMIGIQASITELGGNLTALSEAFAIANATVGNLAGEGLWKITAEAGSGDVVVRLVIWVRATTGDDWVEAGTVWEAGITGGVPFARIVNIADQFIVSDGTNESLPMVFEDGALKLFQIIVEKAQIPTAELTYGARPVSGSFTATPNPTSSGVAVVNTIATFDVPSESGLPVDIVVVGTLRFQVSGGGTFGSQSGIAVYNVTQGHYVGGDAPVFALNSGGTYQNKINYAYKDTDPAVGTNSYELRQHCLISYSGSAPTTIQFQFNNASVDVECNRR